MGQGDLAVAGVVGGLVYDYAPSISGKEVKGEGGDSGVRDFCANLGVASLKSVGLVGPVKDQNANPIFSVPSFKPR